MKALILSAGLGTRLKPLTDKLPKVLVPIGGQPLLKIHLDLLRKNNINDILINTHYLAGQINEFIEKYREKNKGANIIIAHEEKLLGSAGTLKKNQNFFANEKSFLVIYGDNLTDINYQKLIKYHEEKNGIITIASYYEKQPETKGIITFNDKNKILSFIEKPPPDKIISHWANAGIYVFNQKIFDYINGFEKTLLDFGFDIFPELLSKNENMYLYKMTEFLLDIGTPETYNLAQEKIKTLNIN